MFDTLREVMASVTSAADASMDAISLCETGVTRLADTAILRGSLMDVHADMRAASARKSVASYASITRTTLALSGSLR